VPGRGPISFQSILEDLHEAIFVDNLEPVIENGTSAPRRVVGADEFRVCCSDAMDHIVANLPHLAKHFFGQFAEGRSQAATIMREDTWHLASTPGLVAFVRLSKAVAGAFYASGNYSMIQNIDVSPVRIRAYPFDGAFDEGRNMPQRRIECAAGARNQRFNRTMTQSLDKPRLRRRME
jgi:hypothetical protein